MTISSFSQGVLSQSAAEAHLPDWEDQALIYDYRQAANPIRKGLTEPIPYRHWSPPGPDAVQSAILPLDLSESLGCPGPATSPGLAAHFVQLRPGDPLQPQALATSSLFVVLQGAGRLDWAGPPAPGTQPIEPLEWSQGDVFILPHGLSPELLAQQPSLLYWVHDGPLLRYLGVSPTVARFSPCYFSADRLNDALNGLLADPTAARSNRLSVLLAHAACPASRTISHTLWAMVGVVPAGASQAPHRHQSVALDLIADCAPGCYTLVGTELDGSGLISHPRRIEWESGGVFITPPGHWHSHVNTSERAARLLPIQDAGLHTYLRSLDIRFAGGLVGED